ncbi:hypothetical protein RJ639_035272 [Escallonia herrerae]|uniref:Retrotransposon Copia-like N-terminal domain-containing protein n=1 Tax=Escallonia herrerae TaxID=1293975 RepID=A0AA88WQZ5_9ASTE|nr:hypothetical protein RJ639_035272 [Escallonia herrerae]
MATESSSFSGTSSGQESMNTGGSEDSVILITKNKLTGHNYRQWAKSVMMFISRKGKDDYLTGAASPPRKDDLSFRMWKTENNMVMSWLINTMDNEIGQNFLFYDTAYEVWTVTKETYFDNDYRVELFDIKGALHDLRQGEMSVTQYYNTLSCFWQQLDGFESLDWECPADASRYKKIIEKERIFKFLLGLDKSLDEVRGRILGAKPLPTIHEAFSEARREESRKRVMMGTRPSSTILEGSALVSRGSSSSIPEELAFTSAAVVDPQVAAVLELLSDLDSGKMIGNTKESKGLYRTRPDDQQDTRAHHVLLSVQTTLGENSVSQKEYQFWDIPTLDILPRLSQPHSQPGIERSQSDIQSSDPNVIQGGNKELKDKELKVYSRRQKNPKPMEPHMHLEPCQSDVPGPTPTEVIQGNLDSSSSTDDLRLLNDLNRPIAHRKGVSSCTKHPISQFVSYDTSPNFQAFTTNLDNTTVPSCIQEALQQPE